MAVGFWKTPTEATYIARTDSSQNLHLPGMPLGTRGGMAVRHVFPGDGDYTFTIRNLGVGTYIPGEQLELYIDGERVHGWRYAGMGRVPGHGRGAGRAPRGHPARAGRLPPGWRHLRGDELPAEPRRREALRAQVARERPGARADHLPGHRRPEHPGALRRHPRPPTLAASARSSRAGRRRPPRRPPAPGRSCRRWARRAYRRPATADDLDALMPFYEEGARGGDVRGRHRAGAAAHSREPAVPHPGRARAGRQPAGPRLRPRRPRARVAAVVLPLEQHPRRRADRCGQPRRAQRPRGARAAGAAHARRSPGRRASSRTSRSSGCTCGTSRRRPRPRRCSPTGTTSCARRSPARRSCSSRASCARTATSSTC